MFKINSIINEDCVDALKKIPSESCELIFADPPYNLQLSGTLIRPDETFVNGVDDEWDKFDSFAAYDLISKAWLTECKRILKPNGSIWVIGSYHNIFRIGKIIQDLNYWILNDIIWRKTNPMPNFRGRRFTNAHETLIWAAKDKNSKYVFNYNSMKALNEGVQMRSDWILPICSGEKRIKGKDSKKAHPTQKPENLLTRIILASTKKDDLILDPFFGTGTTGAVAKRLGRKFIGIEKEKEYVKIAKDRIKNTKKIKCDSLIEISENRDLPRIPFGSLLESGLLNPGDNIFDKKRKFKANICSDGRLILSNKKVGSIHSLGAEIQNQKSCNGWEFWHVERNGKIISINELRSEIRRKQNII